MKKKIHSGVYYLGMMCTALLHCPTSAENRTVESQSDWRILLYYSYDYNGKISL